MKTVLVAITITLFTVLPLKATVTASTTYTASNVAQADLVSTLSTLSTETNNPSGTSLFSVTSYKNAATGKFTVVAIYR